MSAHHGLFQATGIFTPVCDLQDEGDSSSTALDPAQQLQLAQRESAQQQQARTNSGAGATSGVYIVNDNNAADLIDVKCNRAQKRSVSP